MDSDVLQYLKDNLYIIRQGNSTIISNKFYRDVGAVNPKPILNPRATEIKDLPKSTIDSSKEAYKQFIADAEIPRFINNGFGGRFAANNYSVAGHNAWKDALKTTDYKLLLAATKYYYKQTTMSRVMVSTFFKDAIYESFVDDVKKAMENRDKKTTVIPNNTNYPIEGIFQMPKDDSDRNSLRL